MEMNRKAPTPGSLKTRPTRKDAERDPAMFAELLGALKPFDRSKLTSLKSLAGLLGDDASVSTMSRKISGMRMSPQDRAEILRHIYDTLGLISRESREKLSAIGDAFYFAMLMYAGTSETSQDNARARLLGTFKLYRFSVEEQDEFLVGRIDIAEDANSHALRVEMIQPKQARDGLRGTFGRLTGYMFRISDMDLLFLRDGLTNDIRMTIFPRSKLDTVGTDVNPNSVFAGSVKHVVHMDGFGLGIDGGRGFFSPVYLSLVDDVNELATLNDELDVLPESSEKLPRRVVARLKRNGPMRIL